MFTVHFVIITVHFFLTVHHNQQDVVSQCSVCYCAIFYFVQLLQFQIQFVYRLFRFKISLDFPRGMQDSFSLCLCRTSIHTWTSIHTPVLNHGLVGAPGVFEAKEVSSE